MSPHFAKSSILEEVEPDDENEPEELFVGKKSYVSQ
jgi:hypothetical protein